jgi:hypothetical protein
VLLGRYDRSHGNASTPEESERVSRVHLMVLEIASRLWAVDLGTSNGTYVLEGEALRPIRVTALASGVVLALANPRTRAWWSVNGAQAADGERRQ